MKRLTLTLGVFFMLCAAALIAEANGGEALVVDVNCDAGDDLASIFHRAQAQALGVVECVAIPPGAGEHGDSHPGPFLPPGLLAPTRRLAAVAMVPVGAGLRLLRLLLAILFRRITVDLDPILDAERETLARDGAEDRLLHRTPHPAGEDDVAPVDQDPDRRMGPVGVLNEARVTIDPPGERSPQVGVEERERLDRDVILNRADPGHASDAAFNGRSLPRLDHRSLEMNRSFVHRELNVVEDPVERVAQDGADDTFGDVGVFHRYAGKIIDELGLKGLRVGEAEVSQVHGNFIINRGGATCRDVVSLIRNIRREVQKRTGIELQPEVLLMGKSWEQIL